MTSKAETSLSKAIRTALETAGVPDVAPVLRFTLDGPPVPKARARKGRGGHWYTPEKTRQYEDDIRTAAFVAVARVRRWVVGATYDVEVRCYFPDERKRDADNVGKSVLDALNKGIWRDDSQVHRLTVTREIDRVRPRTEVTVTAHAWSRRVAG